MSSSLQGAATCTTVTGPDENKPCIFPFQYEGVTYNTCTGISSVEKIPWCSTLVDDAGNHVSGQGKYGNCGPECPAPPLTFEDIKYGKYYQFVLNYNL